MIKENSMDECTFLINPTRHPSPVRVLKKILKRKTSAKIIEAPSRSDLQNEVRRFCRSESKFLVIWGGDGTVHEAVNSMMENSVKGKALGFLRGGTGNGIQDSYEIPFILSHQIDSYIESVKNTYLEPVDLLKITVGERIIYGQLVGLGIDTQVLKIRKMLYYRDETKSVKPGVKTYLMAGMKLYKEFDFSKIRETTLTFKKGKYALKGIKINAEYPFRSLTRSTKSALIEIGTRPYYGKMFRICPDVVCNDGNMDAYLFQFTNHMSVVLNFISIWNGWHHRINGRLAKNRKPLIERYEVKEVVIRTGEGADFHIDGELFNTGDRDSIKITIVPKAIDFLVPGSFYHKFHPFENGIK